MDGGAGSEEALLGAQRREAEPNEPRRHLVAALAAPLLATLFLLAAGLGITAGVEAYVSGRQRASLTAAAASVAQQHASLVYSAIARPLEEIQLLAQVVQAEGTMDLTTFRIAGRSVGPRGGCNRADLSSLQGSAHVAPPFITCGASFFRFCRWRCSFLVTQSRGVVRNMQFMPLVTADEREEFETL
jgi:hypothetical protein